MDDAHLPQRPFSRLTKGRMHDVTIPPSHANVSHKYPLYRSFAGLSHAFNFAIASAASAMAHNTPFHTHLTFFSTTPTPSALTSSHPRITLLSGLKASLRLGLNFPVAVLTTLALRFTYGSALNLYLRPVDVRSVRTKRTMLEDMRVKTGVNGSTRHDVLDAARKERKDWGDQLHVLGLWGIAADGKGLLGARELEASRKGELMWLVEEKRRVRGRDGEGVLPFSRGGPLS